MFSLSEMSPDPRASKKRKRLGRGESSGHGKTCGRGGKGQTARSGAPRRRHSEGGQSPLQRRVPKYGFTAIGLVKSRIAAVNLQDLGRFKDGAVVTLKALQEKGIAPKHATILRILGNGKLERSIKVEAHYFTAGATEKIQKANGSVQTLTPPTKNN